jgi:hypothetical protein
MTNLMTLLAPPRAHPPCRAAAARRASAAPRYPPHDIIRRRAAITVATRPHRRDMIRAAQFTAATVLRRRAVRYVRRAVIHRRRAASSADRNPLPAERRGLRLILRLLHSRPRTSALPASVTPSAPPCGAKGAASGL